MSHFSNRYRAPSEWVELSSDSGPNWLGSKVGDFVEADTELLFLEDAFGEDDSSKDRSAGLCA